MCYRIILLIETSKTFCKELEITEKLCRAIKTLLNWNNFWYDASHTVVV